MSDPTETVVAREDAGYRLDDQVGFLLRRAHQRHVAIFAAGIGELTPPQFATLAKLHEVGETSQNQLGALVAMDAATVKGVIDRLRMRGYVTLASHDQDKRRVMVRMTPEGATALSALLPSARRITADTLAPLTVREVETLLRLLAKIA